MKLPPTTLIKPGPWLLWQDPNNTQGHLIQSRREYAGSGWQWRRTWAAPTLPTKAHDAL